MRVCRGAQAHFISPHLVPGGWQDGSVIGSFSPLFCPSQKTRQDGCGGVSQPSERSVGEWRNIPSLQAKRQRRYVVPLGRTLRHFSESRASGPE